MKVSGRAKAWVKSLISIGLSAAFAYLFIAGLDLQEVVDALAAADYVYVPFALALFTLSLVMRAFRWAVLYQPARLGFAMLFPTLLITYAGNNLLPLRAGEVLRAQLLRDRAGISRVRTLGAAGAERLFDIFVLGVFLLSGTLLTGLGVGYVVLGVALTLASVVGLLIGWLIANRPGLPARVGRRDWPLLPRPLIDRLVSYAELFASGFSVLTRFSRFRAAFGLTACAWLLEFGMYWLLAEAFGLTGGYLNIAFAGAAANLALSVPSAQGGVGPFQWATKEALVAVGAAAAPAAAYALALHVLLVAPVSVAGLLVFWLGLPQKDPRLGSTIEAKSDSLA